jgi:hypothetical protein
MSDKETRMKTLIALLSMIAAGQCNAQLVIPDASIWGGIGIGGDPLHGAVFDVNGSAFGSGSSMTFIAPEGGPHSPSVAPDGSFNPLIAGISENSLFDDMYILRAEMRVNGVYYFSSGTRGSPDTRPPSLLAITGPTLHITAPGTYTSTFSIDGDFIGYSSSGLTPSVIMPNLSGSGIVSYTFGRDLVLTASAYQFTNAPEPSTLALFAVGLASVGSIGWRRRNGAPFPAGYWRRLRDRLPVRPRFTQQLYRRRCRAIFWGGGGASGRSSTSTLAAMCLRAAATPARLLGS